MRITTDIMLQWTRWFGDEKSLYWKTFNNYVRFYKKYPRNSKKITFLKKTIANNTGFVLIRPSSSNSRPLVFNQRLLFLLVNEMYL